jgi:16S rRNA (guanine966-N2)-methyltransferase
MRVIAGAYGGRGLLAPAGRGTRPTSDRVREALFSILGDIAGARVLDLFAGSGALAIEALSRGAAQATLVDTSRAAIDVIHRNLEALGIDADVVRQPAVLSAGARVVAESDRRSPIGLQLPRLDERRYGDTLIQIYAS